MLFADGEATKAKPYERRAQEVGVARRTVQGMKAQG